MQRELALCIADEIRHRADRKADRGCLVDDVRETMRDLRATVLYEAMFRRVATERAGLCRMLKCDA
jgi:hypothetical protein